MKTPEQLVDEQVRRWQIERKAREAQNRVIGRELAHVEEPAKVIALSNAHGSGGILIGRRIGELLGVPVYEREILAHIAASKRVRMETLDSLDEHVRGRLDDYLEALFRERNFDQADFVHALTRTVLSLWGHGPCVMIGHGCSHIVPRKHALTLRCVAPVAYRARFICEHEGIDEDAAQRQVERVDAEHASFVRHSFKVEIDDPTAYDMYINTAEVPLEAAARIVVEAFRRKFPRHAARAHAGGGQAHWRS